MGFLVWVVIGGLLGWLASFLLGAKTEHEVGLNLLVGTFGALVGGLLLGPAAGVSATHGGDAGPLSLLVATIGCVLLLALVALFRRRRF